MLLLNYDICGKQLNFIKNQVLNNFDNISIE